MSRFIGVVTTGIYCRPECAARQRPENRREFPTAAAAEASGYRACYVCRPYRTEVTVAADAPELVCRAVRLVLDGWLDEHSERELAERVGASERHLRRLFHDHVGVTPDRLARSARAHLARRLLDDSDLRVVDVVWAAGFGSVRQFNREFKRVFRATPRELRARRRKSDRLEADGGLPLRVGFAPPFDWEATVRFLAAHAWPGVEHAHGTNYRRTMTIDGHPGVLEIGPGDDDHLIAVLHLPRWDGLVHHVQRVRRMLNVDVDHDAVTRRLRADPVIGDSVREVPGVRPVGAWDPFEVGVRVLLGDLDDSHLDRLVRTYGTSVNGLSQLDLTHLFPTPDVLAEADLTDVGVAPRPAAAVRRLAARLATGEVELDRATTTEELHDAFADIPGFDVGPLGELALRLGDPDAFPHDDPDLVRVAAGWRPHRATAAMHLWRQACPDAARSVSSVVRTIQRSPE